MHIVSRAVSEICPMTEAIFGNGKVVARIDICTQDSRENARVHTGNFELRKTARGTGNLESSFNLHVRNNGLLEVVDRLSVGRDDGEARARRNKLHLPYSDTGGVIAEGRFK